MKLDLTHGLRVWELELENGQVRNVLAPSIGAALSGVLPSPVIRVLRKTAFDGAIAPPVLTTLNPSTRATGTANFTLQVNGTGFRDGDTIVWNGVPMVTTFVSATQLTCPIVMAGQVAGAIPVKAQTLAAMNSNTLTFTMTGTMLDEERERERERNRVVDNLVDEMPLE